MKIKKRDDVPMADTQGYAAVSKQIVLGPEDGSSEIILRYFSVAVGGATPYHSHDFPHVVKIEAGKPAFDYPDPSLTKLPAKRGKDKVPAVVK